MSQPQGQAGNDQRSDVKNPNNPQHKDAQDNRADQLNPNNPASRDNRADQLNPNNPEYKGTPGDATKKWDKTQEITFLLLRKHFCLLL